ncbi:hypothetical protein BJ138DRAFT_1016340 [Hygrophoropsis aurantiaca]|uniref:Uncharacterized protein n=1 Tax=Hygrophoropsis aurantiaca TaxID=72124 RepID=A0ACB7ZZ22_9AGAM|nr:hypothetical protein BJ138DRAFT_1016340 [Hygrophoropsis aurantiaca]
MFLDELLRLEGRGCSCPDPKCGICRCSDGIYRCEDCFGPTLWCQVCLLANHTRNPLHRIKEWNGLFFDRITLKGLGLRVQLGHDSGEECVHPVPASNDDFVVIDCHAIHEIALDFCQCESAQTKTIQLLRASWFPSTVRDPQSAATFAVLEQYHLLSFESKVSAFEFYHSIARRTDNTGSAPLRDRYQPFMRMVREWRHLRGLKRAGRGHDPAGVDATEPGQCAVLCPACPQPGKNLPEDWENASEAVSWLYGIYVAIDANFRLKRYKVSSDAADPSLNRGWQYFVEEQAYKAHLLERINEPQEKSTCSGHTAVNSADTKASKGLSATGVGAVDCARHNIKLPNGVGDLQKGEKYVNMDYVVFSALKHVRLKTLFFSYDIACQWHKKIWLRNPLLPKHLQFDASDKKIEFLVPKFHLPAHVEKCQAAFSFNFTNGVGRTDGEAIERGWANINPVSSSTKAMGPGSRCDTLDDHFGDWNWKKTVGLGPLILRKMKEALTEREAHCNIREQLEASLGPDVLATYTAEVEKWEQNRTKSNPFESRVEELTQAKVRLQLAEGEAKELEQGKDVSLHADVSPSILIGMGIDIEDQQRRLLVDLTDLTIHATDNQKARVQHRKNTLTRKIDGWTRIQTLYMPIVAVLRAKENASENVDTNPCTTKLWLPSSLSPSEVCEQRLYAIEWDLRHAQAHDALNDIWQCLRFRSYYLTYKDQNIRGQHPNTRAQTTLDSVEAKIEAGKKKYRVARLALIIRKSTLFLTCLKCLKPDT